MQEGEVLFSILNKEDFQAQGCSFRASTQVDYYPDHLQGVICLLAETNRYNCS